MKQSLKFPNEILSLFSIKGKPAKLERVTAIHMFESSPQSKCAVSYLINQTDGEKISLILVFSVSTSNVQRILRNDSEVTQMCTPGDDTILIVGTIHGSIALYDLKEFDT